MSGVYSFFRPPGTETYESSWLGGRASPLLAKKRDRDHDKMLAAFIARDSVALLDVARAHHERLRTSLLAVPQHTGLFAEPE